MKASGIAKYRCEDTSRLTNGMPQGPPAAAIGETKSSCCGGKKITTPPRLTDKSPAVHCNQCERMQRKSRHDRRTMEVTSDPQRRTLKSSLNGSKADSRRDREQRISEATAACLFADSHEHSTAKVTNSKPEALDIITSIDLEASPADRCRLLTASSSSPHQKSPTPKQQITPALRDCRDGVVVRREFPRQLEG
jgi:hypothetical protein